MEEESESESKNATTAKRSKAEMGGSQRTESMYLDCGNLWILGGSESAVPIAMAKAFRVLQGFALKGGNWDLFCFL